MVGTVSHRATLLPVAPWTRSQIQFVEWNDDMTGVDMPLDRNDADVEKVIMVSKASRGMCYLRCGVHKARC